MQQTNQSKLIPPTNSQKTLNASGESKNANAKTNARLDHKMNQATDKIDLFGKRK